jgi:hypothetical protein
MSKDARSNTAKRTTPVLIVVTACVSFAAFAGGPWVAHDAMQRTLGSAYVLDKKPDGGLELMIFIHRADAWSAEENTEGSVHENG